MIYVRKLEFMMNGGRSALVTWPRQGPDGAPVLKMRVRKWLVQSCVALELHLPLRKRLPDGMDCHQQPLRIDDDRRHLMNILGRQARGAGRGLAIYNDFS